MNEREWHGDTHILLLKAVDEDDGWDYEVLHPSSCKQIPDRAYGPRDQEIMVWSWGCDVAQMESDIGMDYAIEYLNQKITQPGCYRIQGWGAKHYDWEYGWEYDSGISVVGV